MTSKEQVQVILETPGVLAALAGGVKNEQAMADVRDTFLAAVEGHEDKFIAYIEANQKTMEARLKVGNKITAEQKQEIAEATKTEKAAFNALVGRIPEQDRAITAKLLPQLAETYNTPKAAEAHTKMLGDIKKQLIEQTRNRWNPFASKTISDLVANVNTAANKGEAGKGELENAEVALKNALKSNNLTKTLSEQDREALFKTLSDNHAAVVAANEAANPIDTAMKNAAAQAAKEVTNLPRTLVKEALASATGLPPGASTALAAAQRITGL